MYKIEFYVPDSHVEIVKNSMFDAGAGRIGKYDCCSWQTKGQGQFRPSPDSNPYIGTGGVLEKLIEWKVEMVCTDETVSPVLAALFSSHPYEEPAYNIVKFPDKSAFLQIRTKND